MVLCILQFTNIDKWNKRYRDLKFGFEGIAEEACLNAAEVKVLPKNYLKRRAGVRTRRLSMEECVKM